MVILDIVFTGRTTQPALFNCVALVALKSFTKFTGKHLWQNLSIDKLANYRLAALFKKRLQQRCLHVNFLEFLWTAFSQNENYCFQGIMGKKSVSGSRTLPFVTFDRKCPFAESSVILMHFCVISRHFWVKLHKKCPFLKIPNAALKF